MRHVRTRVLVAAWLTIVLVACESTTTRTPDSSTGPTPSAAGDAHRDDRADAGPAPRLASLDIASTKEWSSGEIFLLGGFRGYGYAYDAMADCRARRDDLPEGATDGVECAVDGASERIGVSGGCSQNCPNGRGRWARARLASAETVGATGDRRTGATSANPIHAARPRDTVATTRDRVAPGRAAPDIEDVFDLQRLAGNRAVVQLLKRDKRKKALEPDELPTLSKPSQPGPAQGVESPSDIRYAFFFTGGDAFGKAAWRYVEQYYPTHLKREARSFEQVFQILSTEVAQLATSAAGSTSTRSSSCPTPTRPAA